MSQDPSIRHLLKGIDQAIDSAIKNLAEANQSEPVRTAADALDVAKTLLGDSFHRLRELTQPIPPQPAPATHEQHP